MVYLFGVLVILSCLYIIQAGIFAKRENYLKSLEFEHCRVPIKENRTYNVCVKKKGHTGAHRCFDGKIFE